ncbi:hypothetical protein Gotur_010295 [Gossypium turneri]
MKDILGKKTLNYAFGLSFTTKGLETEFESLLSIWTIIDLSSNQFSGEIPKILDLSTNKLEGRIPTGLKNLGFLEC